MDRFSDLFGNSGATVMLVVTVTAVYVYYTTLDFGYFKKQGIPGPRPWPIFGNMLAAFRKGRIASDMDDVRRYGKIVGTFTGRKPTLLIADPELAKAVMVKEFSNFVNRPMFGSGDKVFDNTLMALRDGKWKFVRQSLAPSFSAAKLKQMTKRVNDAAKQFTDNLLAEGRQQKSFEMRQFTGDFTMDVIASTAFGLQVNSQKERDNPFVVHAWQAFQAIRISNPVLLSMIFCPILLPFFNFFGKTMIPQSSTRFFASVVREALKQRSAGDDRSVDLLQLMINAHKEEGSKMTPDAEDESYEKCREMGLTEDLMISQAVIFFLSGYDTTASMLAFLAYNLALNPDCQDRLIREIDDIVKDSDTIDHDMISQMTYLDMCVQETLRMYPPIIRMVRIAKNDIVLNDIVIRKDTRIAIPIYAIHHDPEVWPDPDKFDPERFTPEEKAKRHPFSHIPFGMGPRNCIGMRLALHESMIAMSHALRRAKFVVCEQTQIPLKFSRRALLAAEKGIWLKLELRE
ncbi:hypothetical protein NP493_1469g00025 [Ridgeia piscesae]|uniref:Cytochrome P450 n=1 Tax=Ridgeia piscesae TaxID=27915 RepID=A0AAD9K1R0_RIDPI|nr:hypothetical protein NP493_1469g00025 [Ridgeia piscesae]